MAEDKKIIKRLEVITGLLIDLIDLLAQKYEIIIPEKSRMARLKQLGLENQEIALLFNKSKSAVSKQIYETKRGKTRKNQKS